MESAHQPTESPTMVANPYIQSLVTTTKTSSTEEEYIKYKLLNKKSNFSLRSLFNNLEATVTENSSAKTKNALKKIKGSLATQSRASIRFKKASGNYNLDGVIYISFFLKREYLCTLFVREDPEKRFSLKIGSTKLYLGPEELPQDLKENLETQIQKFHNLEKCTMNQIEDKEEIKNHQDFFSILKGLSLDPEI